MDFIFFYPERPPIVLIENKVIHVIEELFEGCEMLHHAGCGAC